MDEVDAQWVNFAKSWRKAGKQVYFVLDNPFGEELAPRSLLRRSLFHRMEIVLTPYTKQQAIERDEPARSRLLKVAAETGSKIIDPLEYLCD
jgi:hypothetical protein